ncbi:MAG TPA: TrkA C-terminal domain-containing protein [Solirubrobacteraceae bacterium]|nr:TrkA C-terminal domain-containing protein [Solirubrobacteraceae bacterium]
MYALASLLVVVGISLLITRVAVVILVASGLSREQARFQARSAFTGAGFTTNESEQIVRHPLRRRVVMFLMLLGNAGIVAAAGTLIIGFQNRGTGPAFGKVAELILGLFALLYASRSRWVDRRLTALASHAVRRFTTVSPTGYGELLGLPERHVVVEVAVRPESQLAGRPLEDLHLDGQGVIVLGLERSTGGYESAPPLTAVVRAGDTVILYGPTSSVRSRDLAA